MCFSQGGAEAMEAFTKEALMMWREVSAGEEERCTALRVGRRGLLNVACKPNDVNTSIFYFFLSVFLNWETH